MVVAPWPRDTCRDNQGMKPCKGPSGKDIFKRCQGEIRSPTERENSILKSTGEDPAADLEAFLSYETLPSRPTWSGIRRDHYDYVKEVFAQRGVPINSDTREADIIKFKDALLGYTLYFF